MFKLDFSDFYNSHAKIDFCYDVVNVPAPPPLLKDESGYFWIFGTFLGKVPKYGYMVSPVRWDTYFLVNRVENQKLNQTTAELPFG